MKRVLVAVASVVLLVLVWAALDDITTGSEPSHALEWAVVAGGAVWFGMLPRFWRRSP